MNWLQRAAWGLVEFTLSLPMMAVSVLFGVWLAVGNIVPWITGEEPLSRQMYWGLLVSSLTIGVSYFFRGRVVCHVYVQRGNEGRWGVA